MQPKTRIEVILDDQIAKLGKSDERQALRRTYRIALGEIFVRIAWPFLQTQPFAFGMASRAADVYATCQYLTRGSSQTIGYSGGGVQQLQLWLRHCSYLLELVRWDWSVVLPPGRSGESLPKVASTWEYRCDEVLKQVHELLNSADEEVAADEGPDAPLWVPGDFIVGLRGMLWSVMADWLPGESVEPLRLAFAAAEEELGEWRKLVELDAPHVIPPGGKP